MKIIMHIAQSAGGVERYIQSLISGMEKKQWKHILVVSENYDLKKANELSENVIVLPMEREINIKKDIKQIYTLRKIIKQYNPDIVYLHSSKAGALGRVAAIGLRKKVVYNAHGWSFNMQLGKAKKNMYACIEKFLSLFCNKIIAISEYEKKTAVSKKVANGEKIITIYNGIKMDLLPNYIPESRNNTHYKIGMVGRIDTQKAPDIFVNAAYEIKKVIPNAYFIIVGDGPKRDEIEKLIQSKGLKKCFDITGWVANPMSYIEQFDLAMLLSRWEGFGLAIAEYMYLKKPVIATNVDAIPELIKDGETGLIVEKDNVQDIVTAVKKIYNDDEFKGIIVDKAFNDVKRRFDSRRMAKEHEKLFLALLN